MNKLPIFNPIFGIRPKKEFAQEVVAPPYDVLDSKEAAEMAKGKPLSFLHISKAEIDLPEGTDVYSEAVYKKAAENFEKLIKDKVLIREEKPVFYVYRLQMGQHIQTGLVIGACVDDYDTNRIRKHEFTRPVKEDDRVNQIKFVRAQTGPALLAYKQIPEIDALIKKYSSKEPLFSVKGINDVIHTVWILDKEEDIKFISERFEKEKAVYIADGHHRSAAGSRVKKMMIRERGSNHKGDEPYNCFLAVAFPANEMKIWDYNRVVKDLNGLSEKDFMEKLKENFEINPLLKAEKPSKKREFSMYLSGKWHKLVLKKEPNTKDPVELLDVSVLSDLVLDKILGIKDLRKSDRIDFVGGIRGLAELEKRVDSKEMKVAFALYPTSIEELMAVAEEGKVMPPKSTWFEPKLADGLISNPLL
ncbi:MAG: DUF1015 domain-containing protein [Elusimicrobia bacterium]|nr:DUF1015 domain-containing protein [Elusimicrobiota bacterium]